MNINHLHTDLNKIDLILGKLYDKLDKISWHEAAEVDVAVIQDSLDTINAKLMNYRARVGMEHRAAKGEIDHAS